MRKYAVLAAALIFTASAKADFFITADSNFSAGDGLERVLFYALNEGGHGTGTKAVASEVMMADTNTAQGHYLIVQFVPRTAAANWDVTGSAFLSSGGVPAASDRTFINLLPDPTDPSYDPTAYTVVLRLPNPSLPSNFGGGYSQIFVAGANLSGGVDATRAANGGKGALIAVAVAPVGDEIHLFGYIGGDMGGPQPFDAYSPVPEPGLGLLGLVLPATTLARRRQAIPR